MRPIATIPEVGIFDAASPALTSIDCLIDVLPSTLRLWLWGMLGGALSVGVYAWVSPQRRLRVIGRMAVRSQRRLDAYDGDLASAWPLLGRHLRLALARVGWALGPTALSALPVLFLYAWASNTFAYAWPEAGRAVLVQAQPAAYSAAWGGQPGGEEKAASIRLSDGAGRSLGTVTVNAPVPAVHKRQWWNGLFGNPAGYLDAKSPVEALRLQLPARDYVGVGPAWMRGWEFSFLLALLVSALGLRTALRLQ
ncbi:MAG: hypothetical protein AAGA68_18885 [Pseudomonadota bacterium]